MRLSLAFVSLPPVLEQKCRKFSDAFVDRVLAAWARFEDNHLNELMSKRDKLFAAGKSTDELDEYLDSYEGSRAWNGLFLEFGKELLPNTLEKTFKFVEQDLAGWDAKAASKFYAPNVLRVFVHAKSPDNLEGVSARQEGGEGRIDLFLLDIQDYLVRPEESLKEEFWRVFRHELVHYIQDNTEILIGKPGGLPYKHISYTPESHLVDQDNGDEYFLRDVEFYPMLGEFLSYIKSNATTKQEALSWLRQVSGVDPLTNQDLRVHHRRFDTWARLDVPRLQKATAKAMREIEKMFPDTAQKLAAKIGGLLSKWSY
jgi:hypothetical protein